MSNEYYEFTDSCGDTGRLDLRGSPPELIVRGRSDAEDAVAVWVTAENARRMMPLLQAIIDREPKPKVGEVWVIETPDGREVAVLEADARFGSRWRMLNGYSLAAYPGAPMPIRKVDMG